MNDPIAELAGMIEEASGFVIEPRSFGSLAAVASEQIASLRLAGLEEYMDLLSLRSDSPEWRQLLSRITVKESYLFRGRAQIEALGTTILDELAAAGRRHRLRLWCAGCARGEEAVTLAIVLAGHPVVSSWDWSILATDVDSRAIEEARNGVYGPRAVAAVPEEVLSTFFVSRGLSFEVKPHLLRRIDYQHMNLVGRDLGTEGGPFDVIFLRNVLIYFRPDLQKRVIRGVERSLAPHGALFLGPSESLLPLDANLRPRDLGGSFCYCWPESMPSPPAENSPPAAVNSSAIPGGDVPLPPPQTPESDELTVDERIRAAVIECSAADAHGARRIAGRLRSEVPENALVHVLVGYAATRGGDARAAVLAYRAAHYLDPSIPEIRYLLAGAFEASGRTAAARREYRATLAALNSSGKASPPDFAVLGLPARDEMLLICLEKSGTE